MLNELYRTTTRFEGSDPFDSFLHVVVREHLRAHKPRVMFIGYGDTDTWQHMGRYDAFLETAHSFDGFMADLWRQIQSSPQYKDRTTLIISTDHGRGSGPEEWKDHGTGQKGSNNIWIAVIGPDTAPLGERKRCRPSLNRKSPRPLRSWLERTTAPSIVPPRHRFSRRWANASRPSRRHDDIAELDATVFASLQVDRAGQRFVAVERAAGDARNLLIVDERRAVEHDRHAAADERDVIGSPRSGLAGHGRRRREETVDASHAAARAHPAPVVFHLHFVAAPQVDAAVGSGARS